MVHFVGAGSGAVDLITVRGAKLLSEADVVIYAGSLVNPEHLNRCKAGCEIHGQREADAGRSDRNHQGSRGAVQNHRAPAHRRFPASTVRCANSSTNWMRLGHRL